MHAFAQVESACASPSEDRTPGLRRGTESFNFRGNTMMQWVEKTGPPVSLSPSFSSSPRSPAPSQPEPSRRRSRRASSPQSSSTAPSPALRAVLLHLLRSWAWCCHCYSPSRARSRLPSVASPPLLGSSLRPPPAASLSSCADYDCADSLRRVRLSGMIDSPSLSNRTPRA